LKITELFDQSIFVKSSIVGVLREGVIAASLTALMILLMTLAPFTVCESIDFTSLTTAMTNSLKVVTRCSIYFAGSPEYDQITVTTGISILGKMSVGVVAIDVNPRTKMRDEGDDEGVGFVQRESYNPHVDLSSVASRVSKHLDDYRNSRIQNCAWRI
jgi:hypothetical protein